MRDHENVIPKQAGRRDDLPPFVLDSLQSPLHLLRTRVLEQRRDVEALDLAPVSGGDDSVRLVHEVTPWVDNRDLDSIARQIAQGEHELEPGHASARDDDGGLGVREHVRDDGLRGSDCHRHERGSVCGFSTPRRRVVREIADAIVSVSGNMDSTHAA